MPIRVSSEIRPLKKVLLHRPGSELEQLVPTQLVERSGMDNNRV